MNARVVFITLAVLALGCAGVRYQAPMQASPLTIGSDQAVKVDHLALIVDSSGSLDPETLFPEAKALLESFVGGMPAGSYDVNLIAFGGKSRQEVLQREFDRAGLKKSAYDVRYIGQGTPIDRVIREVQEKLEGKQGLLALVLFSDGLQTNAHGGSLDAEAVLLAATELIGGHQGTVCIHTLHVGDDPAGADMLRRLAALTECGSFRAAASVADVASLKGFQRDVFVSLAPTLPRVAAAPREFASVLFPFDSYEIPPRYQVELQGVAAALAQDPEARLRLDGHTDSIGPKEYNDALSINRSDAVRDFLIARGVPADRLEVEGFGMSDPAHPNDSAEDRALNRRVVLQLSP